MDLQLAGRVFVLTGATRGLGHSVAKVLIEEGASVVIGSRSLDRARHVATAFGASALGVVADIGQRDAGERLIEAAMSRFERLDGVLLNHWGPSAGGPFDLDDDALKAALDVGIVGAVRLLRQTAPHVAAGGALLAVGSTTVEEPNDALAASNVTRPGLWGFLKHLSRTLGPRNVRVNMLLPGTFGTERLREIAGSDAATFDAFAASVPLGRVGNPEEFGRVAAFLLSPAASYITGAAVRVDGGAIRGL